MKTLVNYIKESLTNYQLNYLTQEVMDCLYDVFDEEFEPGSGAEYYKNYSSEAKELIELYDEIASLTYQGIGLDNNIFKEKVLRFVQLVKPWENKLDNTAIEAFTEINKIK